MKSATNSSKKRLLSGIKPTGVIHVGNYFGMIKQFVDMQDECENFLFVADLHALNQVHDRKKLQEGAMEIAKAYLACGLDPKKTNLFRQSDVKTVTELCWIFNSITPMSMLKLAHAYKDAEAKNNPISMGLFDYPVLMAADILIYKSDVVPVGQDQQQHIEMMREIAKDFNRIYGETFKMPKGLILEETGVLKGLDGRKMSKSYGNTIGLFDSEEDTKKKVMGIVTDSRKPEEPKDPETCNVFYFHKIFSATKPGQLEEIARRYCEGGMSYKESKEMLAENINAYLRPMREKKKELDETPKFVLEVLERGATAANKIAEETMKEVRKKVGLGN